MKTPGSESPDLTRRDRRAARRRIVRAALGAIWSCGPVTLRSLADGRLTPLEVSEILTCVARSLLAPHEGGCECDGPGQVSVMVAFHGDEGT